MDVSHLSSTEQALNTMPLVLNLGSDFPPIHQRNKIESLEFRKIFRRRKQNPLRIA